MKFRSITAFILIIISIIIIVVPSLVFIFKYKPIKFSDSISDWGAFGDYFGGVTNTLISLLSLVFLSYISWMISKFTSEESKKLYLLQKRIEAYDELMRYLPKLQLAAKSISNKINFITHYAINNNENSSANIDLKMEEISDDVLLCFDYHYFIFNFYVRFSHLYKN